MNEFLTVLVEHLAIWAPSLVAILGVVATILPVFIKCREYLRSLREDKTLLDVNKQLKQVVSENKELIRCNKLLIDELTRIKGYADTLKED